MSFLNEVINKGCQQCDWGNLDHTFCMSDEEYEHYKRLDDQSLSLIHI